MGIKYKGLDFSDEQASVLLEELGAKHDTSSTTPSATPVNGPFPGNNAQLGIFSTPGGRPGVWNATPRMESISRYIPMFKSLVMNELPEVATGVTAASGTNQTSACVVGPKPGQLKAARIVSTFGIVHLSTKIFDITQTGMRVNRADINREFFNQAVVDNPWLPNAPGVNGLDNMATVLRTEMFALGVAAEQAINPVHFVGVAGVENNTYVGVAKQWNGLDALIKTGWTDSVSGQLAPALDANIATFGVNIAGGTDANGRGIVGALTDTYYGSRDQVRKLGIAPVYALTMHPTAWRAIANSWACSYGTDRCYNAAAGTPIQRSALEVQTAYMDFFNNRYLPMDGENVQVILDDSIPVQVLGNNYYQSDIYGVMLYGNGIPTLFGEYFDMGNPEAMEIQNFMSTDGFGASGGRVINDGLYRVFRRETGGCVEFDFFARPRLLTTTPFAHFRLDNIFYTSAYRQTNAQIGNSYYRDGGVTYRNG
jgi:hypothetical protein